MVAGDIYTVVGNGGVAPAADGTAATETGMQPFDATVDSNGNLIVTDSWNYLVRVLAGSTGTFYGQPMTAGDIYTIAGGGTAGDGGPAIDASLNSPAGVAVDGDGNIIIADELNSRIRVVATSTGVFYGQSMTAGDIYTIAGNGIRAFTGDGGPATDASLYVAAGVTVDAAGNVVIADGGNHRVRVVAAATGTYYGRAMTAGDIYTVAGNGTYVYSGDGGPATKAGLTGQLDIATDGHGNIVIPDSGRIRVIAGSSGTFYGIPMIAGDIYTVAGDGALGYAGDGGQAIQAPLEEPEAVAVASSGSLFIGDGIRIRQVAGP